MKKLILAACFVIGATAMSFAQGGGGAGGGGGQGGGRGMVQDPAARAKRLQTTLTLTDDQTTKITAIYAAQQPKMDSLRKAANGDFQSMMPAMQAMNTATNAKIKALLTKEQADAFDKMPQGGRGGQGGGGGRGGAGGGTPPPPPPPAK